MENKKNLKSYTKKIILVICLLFISVAVFFMLKYYEYSEETDVIEIYYLNTTKGGIEPLAKRYDIEKTDDEILKVVFKLFSENQQVAKAGLVTTKPQNVTVLNYDVDSEGLMTVNFSSEYKKMTNVEEINFRSAFVWTFTDLGFIKKIKFQVDGLPYTTNTSILVDYFDRTNVIVEPSIVLDKVVKRDITLYFSKILNDGNLYLVKEERMATAEEDIPVEEVIVYELINGSGEDNKSYIPSDLRVRTVKRENYICFIDLDEKFLAGNLTEREQKIRVYSLVNSLTELNNVDKVQILINAKKTKGFDIIDISKPLKRNSSIVGE